MLYDKSNSIQVVEREEEHLWNNARPIRSRMVFWACWRFGDHCPATISSVYLIIRFPSCGERHNVRRPNPYTVEGEEDPYFRLVVRFAIEFEKTYIRWLYEALDEIEGRQKRPPVHGDAASPN